MSISEERPRVEFSLERGGNVSNQPLRVGVRPKIPIQVKLDSGAFSDINILIDSGAEVSQFLIPLARNFGIPLPSGSGRDMSVTTSQGRVTQRRLLGSLTFRILELTADREYTIPCHFIDLNSQFIPPVLGLSGLLDEFIITLDGTYREGSPLGIVRLETVSQDST